MCGVMMSLGVVRAAGFVAAARRRGPVLGRRRGAVLHLRRGLGGGVRGGGVHRLRQGGLGAERAARDEQGEKQRTGLHTVSSGGSISSVKKKKVARLSSAAFDGSPSARLTNP